MNTTEIEKESSIDSQQDLMIETMQTNKNKQETDYPQNNHNNFSVKLVIIGLICTASLGTISYQSLYSSLNLFLQKELNQTKAEASLHTALYLGTRYFCTILGAIVSDQYLGRFKTTWLFMSIYFIGSVGVMIIAWIITKNNNNTFNIDIIVIIFWFSIYLIAFGSGGVVPNLGTLGAEQVEQLNINIKYDESSKLQTYKESYFSWKYFGKNVGSLISFTVMAYICQEISFGIGYSMPAIFSFLANLCLIAPSKYYHVEKPTKKSMIKQFIKITFLIISRRDERLNELNKQDVKDVIDVIAVLPIILCYIVYWSVYSQISTLIYAQGCQMNYRIFNKFDIPIATLNLSSIIIVLILVPLLDRIIFPFFRKNCNFKFTMLQKMGLGFIFASLAMITAGIIEIYRKESGINYHIQSACDHNKISISNLSIFWQIIPISLIGISEILTSITGNEFFFNEAPKTMRSVMAAIYGMTKGLGSYLTLAYIVIVNSNKNNIWISNNLNDGHLEYYFFMVAAITFIAFILFIRFTSKYQYKINRK